MASNPSRPSTPSPPFAARPSGPPPPATARPNFASRPPPPSAVPSSLGSMTPNGPPAQRFPSPPVGSQPPTISGPPPGTIPSSNIRPPSAVQTPPSRPFPGSPPSVAAQQRPIMPPQPSQAPFSLSGPPPSQSFGGQQIGATPNTQTFAQQNIGGPPIGVLPNSQPFGQHNLGGPPIGAPPNTQPFGQQNLGSQPIGSQPFRPPGGPPFGTPGPQTFGMPPSQHFGGSPAVPSAQPYMGPPSVQPYGGSLPSSPPLMGRPSMDGFSGHPPAWQTHSRQMPQVTGSVQAPPAMFSMPPSMAGQGMPPVQPVMGHAGIGGQGSTPSKIDPNQIPRPVPTNSVLVFETRSGNQAAIPPPATTDYIVKDTGNCSPRLMRSTVNQIPCTGDLLTTSSMPLALLVQPFALPHPSEEPIQIVDFGDGGPIRCSRCKAYINPFMRFVDHGRQFICNLCGFSNDTPRDYYCNLGPDGRRRDADERPELCRGTVEFVATKEYMVRDPMPAVFFFVIDVSMNAIQTGATAAACSAISQSLADLPEGPRTMVGISTFDSAIHFYNLRRTSQQTMMLIVPDIEDVYTPLHTDIIVPFTECRESLEQLLESIPSMFESNKVADSAFGAAIKAGFLAMKPTGGKLLVFQSVLPSAGIGSLSAREAEGRANVSAGDKEAHKLLHPADKTLKTMAIEFAEYQVCVDIFLTAQTYVDVASISVVPRTTGGQVYYYYPFSVLSDPAKLYNDLKWNISRPQGFEAVMRVRCSQGLQVQEYSGNFCKRIPTDIDLPAIDCDKTIMVTFKHDDKFQENAECGFQCAVLYTTVYGQRRIRVINLSLPCANALSSLFRAADLDTQFACFLKQVANGISESPLSQVREQITNHCINILHSYRKFCATVSSSGQLILPEALKLLPLYTLALIKSIGLRNEGRLDDRCYWATRASSLSVPLAIPLVYPRMISVHDLTTKDDDGSLIPSTIPLSSEHINDDGIYLLENGEDALIYVGSSVKSDVLEQLFGVSSLDGIPSQLVLQQMDNELSKKLNDILNEIRRQRFSYLRLRLCKKGDPLGMFFLSYMVEDKTPGGLSYVEFLVHVHRQIQTKMT